MKKISPYYVCVCVALTLIQVGWACFKPCEMISGTSLDPGVMFWHGMLHGFKHAHDGKNFIVDPLCLEHFQPSSQAPLDVSPASVQLLEW